jgi:hypothetical protein
VTSAQLDQLARFIAADAKTTGLPINRSTVGTHADWNTVTRNNCAWPPSKREAALADLIARAQALAGGNMGLAVKLLATTGATPPEQQFGTAVIKGAGHSIIRVSDRLNVPVAAGFALGTVQRGTLAAPLDGNAGDRSSVVAFNYADAAHPTVEQYVALLVDVTYTANPAAPTYQDGYTAAKHNATDAVAGI